MKKNSRISYISNNQLFFCDYSINYRNKKVFLNAGQIVKIENICYEIAHIFDVIFLGIHECKGETSNMCVKYF